MNAWRSAARHFDVDAGDGLTVHGASTGQGAPVVLLHGFTGSSETWEFVRGHLAGDNEVITIDLPGHGRSSAPADPGRYSLVRFAGDLGRVLDTLSLQKVALLGYSMGGRAAIQFALAQKERVAALILESTSPGISDPSEREKRLAADAELASLVEREGVSAFVESWEKLPLWESQRALPASIREALRLQRLANRPDGLANSLRGAGAGGAMPVTDRLASIDALALVVAGELDEKYVSLARLLATSLPRARLVVIPRAGHAVHLEAPDALALQVRQFLRSVPSAGSRWL